MDDARSPQASRCPGCGLLLAPVDGPTHRYIGASAACWRLYGEVLTREYADVRYGRVHRLTVDTYAAQHPGTASPQSIRSVAIHLIGLHTVLEQNVSPQNTYETIQRAAGKERTYWWLEPPADMGPMTVRDVHLASDPQEHERLVWAWSRSVWRAWAMHHETVRQWAAR